MFVSEYDAFGPWIYEISEAHPLPRLFAPYVQEREPCLMLFKIPREIERRKATPDMDLYDYVVGAYEDRICILKRVEHAVESVSVPYRDIEGVRLFRHLLLGTLTLYLRDGEVSVPFNTVSMDIITRFLRLIRTRYQTGRVPAAPGNIGGLDQAPDGMDILFVNLLRDMEKEGEQVRLCAYQPMADLALRSGSPIQSLAHRIRPKRLPATAHLLGREELIVIQADEPPKKSAGDKYSYHFTYLPLGGIRRIQIAEDPRYQNIADCTLALEHHALTYFLYQENQGASFYRALDAALHETA